MSFKSSTTVADTCTQRIQGLNAHVSPKTAISIGGKSMKLAQLVAIYQAVLDTRKALKSKRAEAKLALKAWQEAQAGEEGVDAGLKSWVDSTYGLNSQAAQDMGFGPRKVGAKTVETKQAAAKQAAATREARHTMGKKQKLKVKGIVPATTEPILAAAPSTAPALPAAPSGTPTNGAPHN
jgi:hypothetical protein